MKAILLSGYRWVKRWGSLLQQRYHTARVRLQAGSLRGPVTVNGPSKVTANTHLGSNVHFNGMTIQGSGRVTIGDNFHSGRDCLIITDFHDYDHGDAVPYGRGYVVKEVNIADNVWLGARVLILGGVSLGEGCIVQAGAVVVSDVPAFAIAGGNPAKVFKHRDVEHYQALKSAGKFH